MGVHDLRLRQVGAEGDRARGTSSYRWAPPGATTRSMTATIPAIRPARAPHAVLAKSQRAEIYGWRHSAGAAGCPARSTSPSAMGSFWSRTTSRPGPSPHDEDCKLASPYDGDRADPRFGLLQLPRHVAVRRVTRGCILRRSRHSACPSMVSRSVSICPDGRMDGVVPKPVGPRAADPIESQRLADLLKLDDSAPKRRTRSFRSFASRPSRPVDPMAEIEQALTKPTQGLDYDMVLMFAIGTAETAAQGFTLLPERQAVH